MPKRKRVSERAIIQRRNFVVATHLDLEVLAREEGVLKAWEHIEVTS